MSGVAAVGLMAIAGVARCGLGLVAMAVGALSRHAKLAFDGAARGLDLLGYLGWRSPARSTAVRAASFCV